MVNNQLIKKKKPCFCDDYVHVTSFRGCFRVYSVRLSFFTIIKDRKQKNIPWDSFICLKGQGNSDEAVLKRNLNELVKNINTNISKQVLINTFIVKELNNLRK